MKKMIFFMALAMTLTAAQAQIRIGGKSINLDKATQAVSKVAKAVTLSDADIYNLCRESVEWMDEHNEVAKDNSEYAKRLARLTKGFKEVNGMPLNFKVYLVTDINAFASGDGSVRVFSSLMDIMDDDELMGVIGHELGHVANTDVKDAMKQAYMTAGLIDAASAVSNTANRLSDTQLNTSSPKPSSAPSSRRSKNRPQTSMGSRNASNLASTPTVWLTDCRSWPTSPVAPSSRRCKRCSPLTRTMANA